MTKLKKLTSFNMAIPKTRSAREKSLILSPQNNPRFQLKKYFYLTFIVHKPLFRHIDCAQTLIHNVLWTN